MRSASACVAIALLGWSSLVGGARAQGTEPEAGSQAAPDAPDPPAAAPEEDVRVAVLLLPTSGADAETADALTELLIAAVAARGVRQIVGKEEVQAQIGRGDEGMVECIESAACLGRIGVQLGVREIVAGTLARREGAWAFNLNRLDVRSGEVLGRAFREVQGDLAALLPALEEALPELWASRVVPARMVVRASVAGAEVLLDDEPIGVTSDEPLHVEELAPGPHVVRVRARGHHAFVRELEAAPGDSILLDASLTPLAQGSWEPSPLIFIGGGVAVAALAAGIGLGVSSQASPDASLSMRETITSFYPARETEAIAADVLFGVAGVGAILAVVGVAISGASGETEDDPSLSLRLRPAGAGALLEGRF